jgi:hypothetical protein
MNQQYRDVLTNLENRRGVKKGLHDYNGYIVSVHHFHGTTGIYRVLHTGKSFKTLAGAYRYIDSGSK